MSGSRPASLRVIRFLVSATWYLGFVVLALLVMLNVAFVVGLDPDNLHVQAPVMIEWVEGLDDHVHVPISERPAPIYIEGLLQLNVAPVGRVALLERFVPLLVLMGVVQWSVWQLRQVLRTVWDGDPFHERNPWRITVVGLAMMTIGPVAGIFHYVQALPFVRGVSIPGASFELEPNLNLDLVLAGLVLLVVARVYASAVELKRDQDLTV